MADVFISYAREDHLAAQRVAETLKRHGWSVWWDSEIAPGKTWDEMIERELALASSVVVLWSATSVSKSWVKTEAAEALARRVLVPVLIEPVAPPLAFRQIQAAPLMDWRGDLDHSGLQQLICSICELAGLPTRPETKDKAEPAKPVRAKGEISARTRPKGAVWPAFSAPVAKLAVAKLPEEPAASTAIPPRSDKPDSLPVPVGRTGGIGRRFAGTAAIALVAALTGYGIRDTLDRVSELSEVRGDINSPRETNASVACAEGAGIPAGGTIAASKSYKVVTHSPLP